MGEKNFTVVLMVVISVTRLTCTSVDVEAVDVNVDKIVLVSCIVKVELARTVLVTVGVVAMHEQADETMLSATERNSIEI